MISSSKAFQKAINKDGRVMSIHDEYIFADGPKPNMNTRRFRSYSINQATSGNSSFDIGATIIKEYKASLDNTEGAFDIFDFEGLDIYARVGLLLEDGSTEIIPKGKFRCVSAKNNENTINIKAYDSMLFFDRPYSESKLTYPTTINQIVADACQCCGMTFDAASVQNGDYVVSERPDDTSLTFRDIIGFCAQIMCGYAFISHLDQLSFGWYDFEILESIRNSYDGGTFTFTDGDSLDGGDFTDYSSGDSVDGGTFEEQELYHHLFSLGSRSINTDDIQITGIAVKPSSDYVEEDGIHLCGEEGYVLLIEENPLIQSAVQADVVAEYIGERMNGKKFRPLNISCKSNPCIEAGDIACVTDRKCRTYFTVITNTTFSFGSLQQIECTAETPTEKSYTKYNAVTKLLNKTKNETKKQIDNYDLAVQQLANLISMSFGMYITKEVQEDGSIIEYQHNKPNLADSDTIWKKTADAFAVSTDGGETWNGGMDSEGNAIVNVLNAIGINANWINTGTLLMKTVDNETPYITVNNPDGSIMTIRADGFVTRSENEKFSASVQVDNLGAGLNINNGDFYFRAVQADVNTNMRFSAESVKTIGGADLDNITGYGSNENGEYYKFSDGTLICIKSVICTCTMLDAWGSMYESVKLDLLQWPYEFIRVPKVTVTSAPPTDSDYGCIIQGVWGTTTKAVGKTQLMRPVATEEQEYYINIVGIGRWK